jgi:hypothetical protein
VIIAVIFSGSLSEVLWVSNLNHPLAVGDLTPWIRTTSYPNANPPTCVAYSGYLYCVSYGSQFVYYSEINSSGIGTWIETTEFPNVTHTAPSCVSYSGRMYCVYGSEVFYASINSSGVGAWIATQRYPSYVVFANQCVVFSGYIYCVGAEKPNDPVNASAHNYVYYAQIVPNGTSAWNETTSYPLGFIGVRCVEISGYIYCLTGEYLGSSNPPCPATPSTGACDYYAKLGPSGVSNWNLTRDYAFLANLPSCTVYSSSVYCISGEKQSNDYKQFYSTSLVYHATANASGIGTWEETTPFPFPGWDPACVGYSSYIYCVFFVVTSVGQNTWVF